MSVKHSINNQYMPDRDPRRIKRYYLHYTVLFLLLTAAMFLPFLIYGRSMVRYVDGRGQYFPQMVYLRRYLQQLFAGILQGKPDIRFYDFSIGMGEGILVAARLHRLDFFSVFIPLKFLGVFYAFVILLRLYLSGIAFSLYCRFRSLEDRSVLIGAVVYLSCGFAMRRVPMHPFFGSAMIMLPMLFLGVEKILQKDSGILLIIASALAFMVTYYYAYMCTIAVAFYFLLRWPYVRGRGQVSLKSAGIFFGKIFHIFFTWLIGVCMMAWLLVPIFSHLSSSDRVQIEKTGHLQLLYPKKYVVNLVLGFISPNIKAGYNTHLKFIALVIPVIVILFFDVIPKIRSLRCAIVLETAGLFLPVVGLVMGAFGNVNNRWTFIFAFTLAYACVIVVQKGPIYSRKSLVLMSLITALYALGTLALIVIGRMRKISFEYRFNVETGCVCLVVTTAVILFLCRKQVSHSLFLRVILILAYLSAFVMGLMNYMPGLGNNVLDFMAWSELPDYYENQPHAILKNYKDKEFFRVDNGYQRSTWLNNSLYHDFFGIAEYNSVINARVQNFLLELESPGLVNTVKIMSMDGRAVCENLAHVEYYLTSREDGLIPYGFEKIFENETDVLYQNRIPLSFAYTYDRILPLSDYEKLSAAQKQQALLGSVVLDDEAISSLPDHTLRSGVPETGEICIPIDADLITANEQAQVNDDHYSLEKDGQLTFSCDKKAGYECYLRLTDISYKEATEQEDYEVLSIYNSSGSKVLYVKGSDDDYYVPMDARMIYMGYSDQDIPDEINIRLMGKGHCKIGSIEIIYIPMDTYSEEIERRNSGGCRTSSVSGNRIEGDLEDGDDRFVVLPVLYSNGWRVEVDGNPAVLMKANRCYSGFYVSKGTHHFSLVYTPPFFKIAILITVCAWIAFIIYTIYWKRYRNLNKTEETD